MIVVTLDLAVLYSNLFTLYVEYSLRGALAGTALLFLVFTRRAAPSDFGLSLTGLRGDLRWIFKLGLFFLIGYAAFVALVFAFLRWGWLEPETVKHYTDIKGPEGLPEFILSALICAPLVEELVYRAFAVPSLALGFGRRGAVFLSGPVWYLLHMAYGKSWEMLHYILAGWILSWAFVRTGRLWVPILLHALGNFLIGLDDLIFMLFPGVSTWFFGPG